MQIASARPGIVEHCEQVLYVIDGGFVTCDARAQHQASADRDGPEHPRCQQVFKQLTEAMTGDIDGRMLARLDDPSRPITVISDAPLEWLRIDGLPLMIRHEMSRICTTPGNLMLQQC